MSRQQVTTALFLCTNGATLTMPVCKDADGDWPDELDFGDGEIEESESYAPLFELIDLPYDRSSPVYQQVYIDPRAEVPPPLTREEVIEQVEVVMAQDQELLGYWRGMLDWRAMRSPESEGYEGGEGPDEDEGLGEMASAVIPRL